MYMYVHSISAHLLRTSKPFKTSVRISIKMPSVKSTPCNNYNIRAHRKMAHPLNCKSSECLSRLNWTFTFVCWSWQFSIDLQSIWLWWCCCSITACTIMAGRWEKSKLVRWLNVHIQSETAVALIQRGRAGYSREHTCNKESCTTCGSAGPAELQTEYNKTLIVSYNACEQRS